MQGLRWSLVCFGGGESGDGASFSRRDPFVLCGGMTCSLWKQAEGSRIPELNRFYGLVVKMLFFDRIDPLS